MLNFSHEIPCPDDRAMRKFLWFAYFHDSDVLHVTHDAPACGDVTLTLRSCLDTDEIYKTLRGTWEEKHAQFEPLLPRVTYLLRFHRVRHFRHVMNDQVCRCADEILDLRFKDTPLLHRLEKEWGRPLYHLRIETAQGLIDIVFERFSIRKQEGRVDYRCDWDVTADEWLYRMQDVLRDADDSPEAAGYNRSCALCARLYRLHVAEDAPALLALARELLSGPVDPALDAPYYAAHLLGHYGDESDIPLLTRLYLIPTRYALARTGVQDAIERITERRYIHG